MRLLFIPLGGSGQNANTAAATAPWLFSGSFQGTYSGNWNNSLNNQGSNGNYWSSTANSATNAYNLNFNSSNINPGTNNNNKYNGFAVRCVLSP